MTEIAITGAGTAPRSAAAAAAPGLGQADFLRLLTAQLQNQDPLKPLDNAEFLTQMAQFSTVAGIDRVNDTLGSMGAGLRDTRLAMAAELLGRSVLVPGSVARAGPDGAVRGAADLDRAAEALVVTWSDAATGAILHSETLGPQPAGRVPLVWDTLPPGLAETRAAVAVEVSALRSGQTAPVAPMVFARVLSAEASAAGADVTLQVEDFGALSSLEIEAFR
jgi:flagellar basal-body rod modification protein FlgD